MEPMSLASFGIGIGSSILGASLGMDQADQQRKETAEQVRRFQYVRDRTQSEATAVGMASGITEDSGSLTKYLADMSKEFGRQTNWMKEAGENRASATETSAYLGMMSNMAGSAFQFGQSNNWFQQPTIK
jgi:hypothetical protein